MNHKKRRDVKVIQTTFLLFLEFHWKLQFIATNVMMVSNFQWLSKSVWIISRPRAEGLTVEDIYRSSGVKSKITKLKATYYSRQRQCVKLGSYEPVQVVLERVAEVARHYKEAAVNWVV